ncbi:DUF418 domain-containing protein [Brevibacillus porteri]|uniref:DUF418 domain-containing protein n=1 Tax=Brevibacillus porteri TaxID=2126350 RepID=A0ABX5FZR5_9BACL|nr:DUF418 domain-containing protein [Brevibacillus porteri]MED1797757.1 DUF418 domain-containing protein [Brevibacillus porteri]MED2130501.1 DUF418 domain-containing protein [Brevibacillus porteri]MED2745250.1 DUF418 domain-containing protein [Brevibacillus porteri]MED2812741.1 DUF418 domain-containing protein [Brevibacillus porteri]MED2895285.1 DUF418 domain-containing protein [Brevibacillus porteri]
MELKQNRVRIIDGLRGFSLVGILMANMLIFQYGIWGSQEMDLYALPDYEMTAYKLVKIFVEGSFMPIFTFMFGFGMIKMQQSLAAKGLKQKRYLARRFLMLIGLGLLHSYFLWEGDILGFYGMMGFFLLLFMNRKPKTLLIWGIVLLCLISLMGLAPDDPNDPTSITDSARMEAYVVKTMTVYGTGTYEEIVHHRSSEDPLGLPEYMMVALLLMAPLMSAPMFLFGMYAAKRRWFEKPEEERTSYLRNMLIFLPAGLLLKVLHVYLPGTWWSGVGEISGGTILAIGYIFAFVWFFSRSTKSTWLPRFQAVGKLSLTNYLLQTVICTTIFYGYGLGWFGRIGVLAGCGLAIVIYVGQLFISPLYLKRFRYGPVERLLRMWTNFSISGQTKKRPEKPISA